MIYSRGLLLKGLLGFGAVSAASYGGLSQKEKIAGWFSSGDEPAKPAEITEAANENDLPGKVGLNCPTATAAGVDCSKAAEGNIKVKQEQNKFEVSTIPASSKIKLYKLTGTDANGYNQGLKFVIEGGDIAGTEEASGKKLEEFETYEIKKEENTDNFFLTRKKKSWEEKRRLLGLPDTCEFPEAAGQPKICNLTNSEDIKKIKFDGKTDVSLTGGSVSLKVEVTPTTETTDFPLGYKFTLTPAGGTLTINKNGGDITIPADKATEFKIKKSGSSLTLEKAWTLERLTDKVKLSCTASGSDAPSETNGVECTKKTGTSGNIKVKKNGSADFEVSDLPSGGNNGKIKVYKTSAGEDHNEGFKFVIEGGDISSTNSSKLEQFETYEIKKEGSDWKLNRKTEAKVGIKKALGLDNEGCDLPSTDGCDVAGDKFKKIKFSAGDNDRADGPTNAKLKITAETDKTEYPLGYKFVLESEQDAKISDSLTIKGKTNTEFKIKKSTTDNNISLEKALDAVALGKKINLTCTSTGAKECSLETGQKINVKDGSSSRKGVSFQNGDSSKKLTYTENHQDYNQGIKFTATQEICLETGEQSSGSPTSIANNGEGYEIKKDSDGTWYLTKKNNSRA